MGNHHEIGFIGTAATHSFGAEATAQPPQKSASLRKWPNRKSPPIFMKTVPAAPCRTQNVPATVMNWIWSVQTSISKAMEPHEARSAARKASREIPNSTAPSAARRFMHWLKHTAAGSANAAPQSTRCSDWKLSIAHAHKNRRGSTTASPQYYPSGKSIFSQPLTG